MAGVTLSYGIDDRLALAALSALAEFDRLSAFQEIGEHLVSATVGRFRAGTDADGTPWIPSVRVLKHPGSKTLVDHGHLRDSVTYRAFHNQLEVGSNLPYAAIHQLGGQAGRGHSVELPARPYLGISVDDAAEIDAIVARHVQRALR